MNLELAIKEIFVYTKKIIGESTYCGYSDECDQSFHDYESLKQYLKEEQSEELDLKFSQDIINYFLADNVLDDLEEKVAKKLIKNVSVKLNQVKNKINSKSQSSEKENRNNTTMSDNKGILRKVLDTGLGDSKKVLVRVSAKQIAKTVAEPITNLLIMGLDLENNDQTRGKIAKFLNSDLGMGMLSFGLSFGVKSLPLPEAVQDLVAEVGEELRIQGETALLDPVVETFAAPMRALLTDKVMALPALAGMVPALPAPKETITVTTSTGTTKSEIKPAKKTAKKPAKSTKKTTKAPVKAEVKKEPDEKISF